MRKVVLALGLLFISGMMWGAVPTGDFNWEKYFSRLERIRSYGFEPSIFIDNFGNKYFGTKNVLYAKDHESSRNVLKIALTDSDPGIRCITVEAIVVRNYPELLPIMIECLKSEENIEAKRYVIWGIGKIGNEKYVLPLTQILKNEKNREMRAMLALALGRIGGTGDEIRPLLYMADTSNDILIKCAAILGIGRLKMNEGEDILMKTINNAYHEVRYSSILSLTFLNLKNENDVKIAIEKKFNSENSIYVKISCAFFMLKRFGFDRKYVDYMIYYLDDNYHKMAVLDFMENLRYPKFVQAIELRCKESKNNSSTKLLYEIVLRRMKNPNVSFN